MRKPTINELTFAKVYAETGDAVVAYKEAYPEKAAKTKYLASAACHKLDNPTIKALIEEIQQGMRAQYVLLSPEALNNLWELANNAKSEKVRLEANKEILYGAGLKPPEEVKLSGIELFGSMSAEDIRNMIRNNIESITQSNTDEKDEKEGDEE